MTRTKFVFLVLCLFTCWAFAQQNKVMGEIQFAGASDVEKTSGVWVDGQYVGYLRELKNDKKVMLLPGQHEIVVRKSGFKDFSSRVLVEPGQTQVLSVKMDADPRAEYAGKDAATLKLNIEPERAAVFVDNGYVGHVNEFGGAFHSMALPPGKHKIKVELPGYKTFETELDLRPEQKAEVKTKLKKGSIEQAGPLIKEQ